MIYSTDDKQILSASFAIRSEQTAELTIRIDCKDGQTLSSEPVAGLTVEARKVGDISYTDLESGSIDLSPDAGTQADFEILLTADTITSFSRVKVPLVVGWTKNI